MDLNLFLTDHYMSTVVIELFDDRPLTRDNFLLYVDGGHYDGTIFHRLVPGFVLQGGGFYETFQAEPAPINFALDSNARVDLDGNLNTANPAVANEFGNTPFRSNLTGTLAMAKTAAGPDSATNQFFFNLANNSANLDNQNGGFTVFAEVAGNGMDLITALTTINQTSLIQLDNYNRDLITENAFGTVTALEPDGRRDFGTSQFVGAFKEVPILDLVAGTTMSESGDLRIRMKRAERTHYFAAGTNTDVPTTNYAFAGNSIIDAGATFTPTGAGTGRVNINTGVTVESYDDAVIGAFLVNSGHLRPGMQTGELTVKTFLQSSFGTTHLQLGGTTAGDSYDKITSQGNAILAGALQVELLGSFNHLPGDSFTLLETLGTIVNDFQSVDLPDLAPGLLWDYQKASKTLTLSVVAPDFNSDGVVDAADYSVWRDAVQTGSLIADANGDLAVNQADYEVWRRFYGTVLPGASPSAATGAPEPMSALLAALACLAAGAGNRRWHDR
ncbi:MAG: peptidylprolyl isomerase [Planctomycetales bacterium]|nr:peptidylprolyl isomerase [Planctomycetales bacterium]